MAHNLDFKVMPLFDAEMVRDRDIAEKTYSGIGTCTCPNHGCYLE